MELKVDEVKELSPIKFNYEEIKNWVIEKSKEYKSIVYTEDTIENAKTDRATLNKVTKAINDEKIRLKKEVLKPFEDFEKKCKELQGIMSEATNSIDSQIKSFEEKEQNKKREQIKEIFNTHIGDFKDLISFETIFNSRWLNKTYSIKNIEEEIKHIVVKTNNDFEVIDGQIKDEVINKQVKAYYFKNIAEPTVLGNSLQEGLKIVEANKKLEEFKKQQEIKQENKNEIKTEEVKVNTEKVEVIENNKITETIETINFRVWVTKEQKMKLREFLIQNNIKYGKVD